MSAALSDKCSDCGHERSRHRWVTAALWGVCGGCECRQFTASPSTMRKLGRALSTGGLSLVFERGAGWLLHPSVPRVPQMEHTTWCHVVVCSSPHCERWWVCTCPAKQDAPR